MSKLTLAAAALMALTTAVHLFIGTPEVMDPIRNAGLHPVVQSTAMVVWHVITLLLALMTLALGYLATRQNAALSNFIIAVQLSFALLFLYYTVLHLGALFALPQWTVFLAVPALMLAARLKAA